MTIVDTHAHLTPERYKRAIAERGEWYGYDGRAGELHNPGFVIALDERLAEMDRLGVDVQLLSAPAGFYGYARPLDEALTVCRECNDEIAEVLRDHPGRFKGLAIVPMQDVPAAIAELERATRELGLVGLMISDHVLGKTYDEPDFLPFWEACERLGSIVFFHQGFDQSFRIGKYHLDNAVGNLTQRAFLFGILAYGGVLDRFPKLKLLLAHAGGFAAFAAQRMDKAWGAFPEDACSRHGWATTPAHEPPMQRPPSAYLDRFYYDCCTFSPQTLRFLIDVVGIDRVVLGTDYPAPMVLTNAVEWVRSLDVLTGGEKEAILSGNVVSLLAA